MTTIVEAMAMIERVQRQHREHVAEARACGQEPVTWQEWIGQHNAKAEAQARWEQRERADELDLY